MCPGRVPPGSAETWPVQAGKAVPWLAEGLAPQITPLLVVPTWWVGPGPGLRQSGLPSRVSVASRGHSCK